MYTRLHKLHLCASHRDTLTILDILGKGYDTKNDEMEQCTHFKDQFKQCMIICFFVLFFLVLLFICHQIPEIGMDQISRESVSRAFGGQDEADLSSHNYSMELEFSFDEL